LVLLAALLTFFLLVVAVLVDGLHRLVLVVEEEVFIIELQFRRQWHLIQ